MSQVRKALRDILRQAGRPLRETDKVAIIGQDPVLPTNFLIGTAGAAVIAANGLAAADIWELRTGRRQDVSMDMVAAAAALRRDRYILIDGESGASSSTLNVKLARFDVESEAPVRGPDGFCIRVRARRER